MEVNTLNILSSETMKRNSRVSRKWKIGGVAIVALAAIGITARAQVSGLQIVPLAQGFSPDHTVNLHVEDVRCGGREQKVMVCYHGYGLCVNKLAVPILLYLGSELGACETGNARMATNADQPQAITDAPQKFIVYPTPASSYCTIAFTLKKPGKYQVALYNTQGRLIQVVGKGETTGNQLLTYPMNTSQLSTGVYFVKLVTATEVKVKQLIIQR